MKRLITIALVSAASSAVMAEGITWSGDFKYRYERFNQQKSATDLKKFNQERLSLKLGASATPIEGVKIEARLATGDGRTNLNQTLGEANLSATDPGKNYNFKLDRANLTYDVLEGLVLSAGRMGVKYNMVGGSDMLWDGDVNLDGLHLGHKMSFGEQELMANIGSFQIVQSKTALTPKESTLQAYQLATKGGFGETKYTVSAALYNFNNYGNTVGVSNNGKAVDFQVVNPGLEVKLPISLPVTLFIDYAKNTAGNTDNKETAYMAGVKINSLKDAGSWMVAYDFREIEKFATAGVFTDSESFYSGFTDGRGHRVKTGYQLNSAMSLGANYFAGKANIATAAVNYSKIQFDLNAKF